MGLPLRKNGSRQWSSIAANMTKVETSHVLLDGSIWHYPWGILTKKKKRTLIKLQNESDRVYRKYRGKKNGKWNNWDSIRKSRLRKSTNYLVSSTNKSQEGKKKEEKGTYILKD